MASCIKEKPGPLVALITLRPVKDAPIMAHMEAISSSIWMNFPPIWGSRSDKISVISLDGVMGYPA
jgi:hypothetical protein